MHEHPEDLNPEAAIHFESGRPPKTAGKTKRQNAIVAVRHPPPSLSSPGLPALMWCFESLRRLKADGCVFARRR